MVLTSRGGVGCYTAMPLGSSAGLPCQAGLRPHSQSTDGKRLTTKGLALGVL